MITDTEPIIPEDELDRLSAMGRTIYREKLKAVLEPEFNGQDVAIHLDTGDYEVGPPNSNLAIALRKRHPEGGMIMVTDVGPPRIHEMLAARMAGHQEHGNKLPCYS